MAASQPLARYFYVGRTRPDLVGRVCTLRNTWRRGGPHNVLVRFDHGELMVCPMRCLRRDEPGNP